MTIFAKLPSNSGHLLITNNFFKTRRCPLFRGFTVFGTQVEKQGEIIEKQGVKVFLPLTSQDKQTVRTIRVQNLSLANGVKLIIEETDKLNLKDESTLSA